MKNIHKVALPLMLSFAACFSVAPIQAQEEAQDATANFGSQTGQQYEFSYSKLYTQLKNNLSEGHPDIRVGFFFQERDTKETCQIVKAWMSKDKHYEEFDIPATQELVVPLDNNLRQVGPTVYASLEHGKSCDFAMVVMTKEPLSGTVTYQQIQSLLPQMSKMYRDLGGMFSRWFAPDVIGLTLEFSNLEKGEIQVSDGRTIHIQNNRAQLSLSDLQVGDTITLPASTFRVLPLLAHD
ncbi:MAG: DUF2987 domain-containing protein [Vibrio sp.]